MNVINQTMGAPNTNYSLEIENYKITKNKNDLLIQSR